MENSRELLIVFIYDTEVNLREEEDPQTAIVYFHPAWVNANQRMALCGQLIGVTQFFITCFSFPRVVALRSGKFTMKRIGRFLLCIGTDKNISDWILIRRCEILYNTLQFFHANLNAFLENGERRNATEKISNAMEVYLPVILYAGNILGNSPTIRLPKSASNIFLEAAQILECLQDNEDVYGGAIFYQNKVVMSQFSTEMTKQIVMMDPYRIKIPGTDINPAFTLPINVQLLTVYVSDEELKNLSAQKIPTAADCTYFQYCKNNENGDANMKTRTGFGKENITCFSTLAEEESESEYPSERKRTARFLHMPDIVKDTVKKCDKENYDIGKHFNIKIESFIVDSAERYKCLSSNSDESLRMNKTAPLDQEDVVDGSFDKPLRMVDNMMSQSNHLKSTVNYYNTISDPLNPWFRQNGLPASKSFHDDTITSYCQEVDCKKIKCFDKVCDDNIKSQHVNRPASLPLSNDNAQNEQKTDQSTNQPSRKLVNLTLQLKKLLIDPKDNSAASRDEPVTPLMSKLSLSQLPECDIRENVLHSVGSLNCITDEMFATPKKRSKTLKSVLKSESQIKYNSHNAGKAINEATLFVFGYQNISIYLLLNIKCMKNIDLIQHLSDSCRSRIIDLEKQFYQCFDSAPHMSSMNANDDSYNYLNIHSSWETLQYGGPWTNRQLEVSNTLRGDFEENIGFTDITARLEDCVMYGNRLADNQVYYSQNTTSTSGLPMPSDIMGIISLKAKRRLERDHGILIV